MTTRITAHTFTLMAAAAMVIPNTSALAQSATTTRANEPPRSVTSQRMMSLARDGKALQAASIGRGYLSMHPGTPATGEHCMILAAYAYADLLLGRQEESTKALDVFDRGCKHKSVRDEYRLEAKRIHRVLNGEAMNAVYPALPAAKAK